MSAPKPVTFETVVWANKDSLLKIFPFYVQEKVRTERDKSVSNTVDIDGFTLQTPFKDKTLLEYTTLHLEPNKRHCLFGRNGTGKTLLFERMADGSIKDFPKHLHVHHLHEMEHKDVAESVFDTVIHSHTFLMLLRKCDAKLKEELAAATAETKEGLEQTNFMVQKYLNTLQSDRAEDNATKMLRALGFDEFGMKMSTNDLSGGLRMRVALACAFFVDADLLLLDEPTNHLDFPSVLWLENRLRGYRGSFLLVTHDRDLLINVTTSTMLLEDKKIHYYPCGFGEFEKRKAKEDKQKDEDVDKFVKQNRGADPSTQTGRKLYDMQNWQRAYQKKLVQMAGKFTFPKATELAPAPGATQLADGSVSLIKLSDVRFSYNVAKGMPFIFDTPINFEVTTKSRVGIMGPNGAGKSTLLKLITKKIIPTEGKFEEHPNFITAYFGQHSTAELDPELTPLEFMQREFPKSSSKECRDHLEKTGVSDGVESTRMKNLSYSQRSCVIFSKLTFVCPHLLIMDEPTNFLDLESVDSLIAAANKFPGALLVVTHSRGFLRKCAKSFLSVVPGRFLAFDNMKEAEESTYTFIQELESGVKMDASALSAGGGSMATHNTTGGAQDGRPQLGKKEEKKVEIVCPEAKFVVGEKVSALFTDKQYHDGEIVALVAGLPKIKYSVFYPAMNTRATIPEAGIKKSGANASKEAVKDAAIAKKEAAEAAAKVSAAHKYEVGEKILCMKDNGTYGEAKVVKINGFDMFIVELDGKQVTVALKKIRIWDANQVAGGGGGGSNTNKGGRGGGNTGGNTGKGGGKGGSGRGR